MEDLAAKKCVPCNSKDLQAMTEESANDLLSKVAGWNLVNENGTPKLNRSWKVKSFTKGLELFKLVGNVAEAEGHHPDLHLVGWNNITIEIWTHAVGENFVSNHMASLFKVIFLYIYVQVTIPMPLYSLIA
ncbi:hypothetical protein H0E87_020653 [Populus deltoides]|uniref:4a-hydroxytetrahydrobiopterin dehydratase n=1 Tax=Populus deltoides TaxID=3696 RepID=A0A8T2XLV0_POPDE|nr:hypothetical protein H0E87_020653 [Populus deltoides]